MNAKDHLSSDRLPPIPNKRYFTISEVAELCLVKPHVLRFWEQSFPQLRPTKRENRRYYTRQDIDLVRQIRDLLYEQLFTIKGARVVLEGSGRTQLAPSSLDITTAFPPSMEEFSTHYDLADFAGQSATDSDANSTTNAKKGMSIPWLKQEILSTLAILRADKPLEKP